MENEIIQAVREKAVCCNEQMKEDEVYMNGTTSTNFICLKCGYFIHLEQETADEEIVDGYKKHFAGVE